jgi:hypothetical protein
MAATTEATARSTPSPPAEGSPSNSPKTVRTTLTLPGGVARSGFSPAPGVTTLNLPGLLAASALIPTLIHKSAWNRNAQKFALFFWIYERLMVRSIGGTKALLGLICLNPTYSPALEPIPQHHSKLSVECT